MFGRYYSSSSSNVGTEDWQEKDEAERGCGKVKGRGEVKKARSWYPKDLGEVLRCM